MKKVLSFVLVSSLVLGSFSAAFADTSTKKLSDLSGKNCQGQAQALTDLNVISGYTDGTFKPEKAVTRAEMSAMIVKAFGLNDNGATNSFPDAKSHWGKGWIGLAQNLDIIAGYPNGTFRPDNNVTYNEAITMIVKALGYNQDSLTGTWPGNYLAQAQRLGITDDVTATTGNAVRGDIAIMIFNALEQTMGKTDKNGDWNPSTKTMLDGLGAVVDADFRVITDTSEGYINLYDMLGKSVKAYTMKSGANANKIIAIKEVESTTLVGKIKSTGQFESNDVTYYFNDGNSTYHPFVNGKSTTSTNAAISGKTGTMTLEVKLSGKSIDKIYSVSEWNGTSLKYDPDMLDGKNFDIYTLPTEVDGKTVDTKEFQLLGADSLDKIAKDSIVTVYVSGSLVTKIEVSTETATGTVSKISADADKEYTIGGKVYTLADNPAPTTPKISESGTARLDYAGKIAEWKVSEASQGNYGLVLEVAAKSGLTPNKVKLVTKEGETVVYEVASTAEGTTAFDNASAAALSGGLIEYSTDKDGKIKKVTDLTGSFTGFSSTKVSKSGSLVGTKPVDSGAVIFVKKTNGEYTTTNIKGLQNDKNLDQTSGFGYYLDSSDGYIKAMIVAKVDTTATNSVFVVLNAVDEAVNPDGDVVNYVIGFKDGKVYEAYTDNKGYFSGFSGHDGLYELTVDANGNVTGKVASVTSESALLGVTISSINGNIVKLSTGESYQVDSSVVVYQYNTDTDKYEAKSLSSTRGKLVNMYQVDKDSEQFDIIVIN